MKGSRLIEKKNHKTSSFHNDVNSLFLSESRSWDIEDTEIDAN